MIQRICRISILMASVAIVLSGCLFAKKSANGGAGQDVVSGIGTEPFELIEVAVSDRQWTGVAVSADGRIFVNFPRWSESAGPSVAEVLSRDGTSPYPANSWNKWDGESDGAKQFVCVQSVYIDRDNVLWVLDSGNPYFQGVIEGAPKLVKIDLQSNKVVKTWPFDSDAALPQSYLNDVRIDIDRNIAYITDSGVGAIVVLDLESGRVRRLLERHASTQSEAAILKVDGMKWKLADGTTPEVHADGIALDGAGNYLYYHALTGKTLYRIATGSLLNEMLTAEELGDRVERLADTGAVDGMLFGQDGLLYLSTLETNSISRYGRDGIVELVVRDQRLSWPDSFSTGSRGNIYVTVSQVHQGASPKGPYRLFRLRDPAYLP